MEIKDIKKTDNEPIKSEITIKEEKESLSDEFLLELDEEEKLIFLDLKSVLIDKCELLEFEAVTEESLDGFRALITYIKNGIITVEDNGVSVKLRRSILSSKGVNMTDKVKILFDRNEDRERIFTKGIKISKRNVDLETQKSFTRATLAASLENIQFNGGSTMLNAENIRSCKNGLHEKDYKLLITCYDFFRS